MLLMYWPGITFAFPFLFSDSPNLASVLSSFFFRVVSLFLLNCFASSCTFAAVFITEFVFGLLLFVTFNDIYNLVFSILCSDILQY